MLSDVTIFFLFRSLRNKTPTTIHLVTCSTTTAKCALSQAWDSMTAKNLKMITKSSMKLLSLNTMHAVQAHVEVIFCSILPKKTRRISLKNAWAN